jgi:hypothetical protein
MANKKRQHAAGPAAAKGKPHKSKLTKATAVSTGMDQETQDDLNAGAAVVNMNMSLHRRMMKQRGA